MFDIIISMGKNDKLYYYNYENQYLYNKNLNIVGQIKKWYGKSGSSVDIEWFI